MKIFTGYIGTYDSPRSFGIYRFTLDADTGNLSAPELFYRTKNAKCASVRNGLLAAVMERGGKAGVCLLDANRSGTPLLGEALCEKQTSCFIEQDENFVYTANYHEGTVSIYQKDGATLRLSSRVEIAPKAGCHQALLHAHVLIVPCLELDALYLFDRTDHFSPAGKIDFPAGSGPRHGVFDRKHERFFVVSERSNELFCFRVGARGEFELTGSLPFLPAGAPKQSFSAAIRMSPDDRFLYVSTRGANLITVFAIDRDLPKLTQQISCGGEHPRDFLIAPGGRWLLVVNRSSNDLVSFTLDRKTGRLGKMQAKVYAPEGVGITLE